MHKTCPTQIKAAGPEDGLAEGQFRALVSVFNNTDSMGDVVVPGAFEATLKEWAASGDRIPVYWSHQMHDPDFNIGWVDEAAETDAGLEVLASLDLADDAPPKARQVYRLMKGRRVTQFSFAYDVLDEGPVEKNGETVNELRALKLYEVGPTPVGANTDTELIGVKYADLKAGRVLSAKNEQTLRDALDAITGGVSHIKAVLATVASGDDGKQGELHNKGAVASHSTATSSDSWDGAAQQAHLSNDAGAATYRKAYAWQDPEGDPDAKQSWRFIHHFVDADGAVGAASTVACSSGIAILNGGRGGTTIPAADKTGVYNHLARHLRDADMEPPELASGTGDGEPAAADQEKAIAAGPVTGKEPPGVTSKEPSRHAPVSTLAAHLNLLTLEGDSHASNAD